MNKRSVGAGYEARAASWLQSRGYHVIERNYYTRYSEIDLIVTDGEVVVFVEVKYRKDASCGHPEEAVSRNKMRRISRAADVFLAARMRGADCCLRFDVIAIEGDELRHYADAFPYIPAKCAYGKP